ncbi:MAG: hypothetical protein PVF29_13120, partial [Desulfobacterales bacterium]
KATCKNVGWVEAQTLKVFQVSTSQFKEGSILLFFPFSFSDIPVQRQCQANNQRPCGQKIDSSHMFLHGSLPPTLQMVHARDLI